MAKIAPEYAQEWLGVKIPGMRVFERNGICVLAQLPTQTNNPRTEAQQLNRMRFRAASCLATEMRDLYRSNYMPLANRLANHSTPRSLFMTHLLRDVVSVDFKTKEVLVDYDRICLEPPLYLEL